MSDMSYRPGTNLQPWNTVLPNIIQAGVAVSGHGSPEGAFPAPVGKIYTDIDTGDIYQKEVGSGSPYGWVKRGAASVGTGTVGSTGIPFKTTAERDAWTPTTAYAACLLIDSVPPFQLSIWANGVWN